MREEDYREVRKTTPRGQAIGLHWTLLSVTHILKALKSDAKRTDFRMKDVGQDLLTVLDNSTQEEENPVVAQEVSLLNGALALLGNANHPNNLARHIKREIGYKYAHLCSDKVPMTRLLFGDDVPQLAKQIEETGRLKSKFTYPRQNSDPHIRTLLRTTTLTLMRLTLHLYFLSVKSMFLRRKIKFSLIRKLKIVRSLGNCPYS